MSKKSEFLKVVEDYKTLKREDPKNPKLKELLKKRFDLINSGEVDEDTIFAASLL